jgi:hypothetical protein
MVGVTVLYRCVLCLGDERSGAETRRDTVASSSWSILLDVYVFWQLRCLHSAT